jgi:hypothetical protein
METEVRKQRGRVKGSGELVDPRAHEIILDEQSRIILADYRRTQDGDCSTSRAIRDAIALLPIKKGTG